MKYFNEASALYMFLTLDIKGMNEIRLISRTIHAPNHELEDTDTNTPPTKLISRRIFVKLLGIREGDRCSTVVKVLCYKSEGRWFDPSWCQ